MVKLADERVSTGVEGLDEILHGGLVPRRVYLARGAPGTGKTTLGLHFLSDGVAKGETSLFITLADSEEKARENAESIGITCDGIIFLDLSPRARYFSEQETYDIFSSVDVEREPTTRKIIEVMDKLNPQRVFLDPTSQLRYFSPDLFLFRKQSMALLRFLIERHATVLWTSEVNTYIPDDDLQFISDGVIYLSFAPGGWTVSVTKQLRSGYRPGEHAMVLDDTGMHVFPRLVPEAYQHEAPTEVVGSGIAKLDEMLHGGLERGTITIISGPAGVGKTTLGMHFLTDAASKDRRAVAYLFEEEVSSLLRRCDGIGLPAREIVNRGTLSVRKIEPLRFTPDEFAQVVRREIEGNQTQVVMIDNIDSYQLCLRGGDLAAHMHALCKYLQNMGVTVLLINEVESITGEFKATEIGISYMADNIIFMRYFEVNGALCRAIGVLKKRMSDFDKTMREFEITEEGLRIGETPAGSRGIIGGP